ncbi:MAG TPA: hypothetical protein VE135_03215 [Pyrinomonadaceae bacterium]|nr:hypothetical protein [Pyrinomonadaceae bacterium]
MSSLKGILSGLNTYRPPDLEPGNGSRTSSQLINITTMIDDAGTDNY